MFQNHDANVLRADLGSADSEFLFNLSSKKFQLNYIKAKVLGGRPQTSKDLETIKGFAGPISLHYNEGHFLNAFKGRESSIAG